MPPKIRLFDYASAEKDAPLGGYPQAIAKGIALGLQGLGEIVLDTVVYPAFDAAVICAHLSHFNLNEIEASIRNNPALYTDLIHRMESRVELGNDIIYELPLLAYDAGIILAQRTDSHPDFTELKACLDKNPAMYHQSAFRMQQRMQPIAGAFEQFMQAPGPEKAEILAELSTAFFGPSVLLKGTAAIRGAVKTYQEFGAPRVARFHPLIAKDISPTPLKFDLLSLEDIRATPGGNSYIWVYGKDKKLKIAARDLPPDPVREFGSEPFLRHHELANADWFYKILNDQKITRQILRQLENEGWVYSAGEAHFNYGNLEKLTLRSGHFKPQDTLLSPELGRWTEQIFSEYGFSEAPGKYKPLVLSYLEEEYCHPTVSYGKSTISLQQKISAGIVGAAIMGRTFLERPTLDDDSSSTGFVTRFREQFLLSEDIDISRGLSFTAQAHSSAVETFFQPAANSSALLDEGIKEKSLRSLVGQAFDTEISPKHTEAPFEQQLPSQVRLQTALSQSIFQQKQADPYTYPTLGRDPIRDISRIAKVYSTPITWRSASESTRTQTTPSFFSNTEQFRPTDQPSFTYHKHADGTGFRMNPGTHHNAMFGASAKSAQRTLDQFQSFSNDLSSRTSKF